MNMIPLKQNMCSRVSVLDNIASTHPVNIWSSIRAMINFRNYQDFKKGTYTNILACVRVLECVNENYTPSILYIYINDTLIADTQRWRGDEDELL